MRLIREKVEGLIIQFAGGLKRFAEGRGVYNKGG